MNFCIWVFQTAAHFGSGGTTGDNSRHRIYHGLNLFCCSLYLHTVTVDRSSLYNGFISHRRPETCPKDMFVWNAMSNRWGDAEWVMKIYARLPSPPGLWGMGGTSLATLYGSFIFRSADAVVHAQFSHTCLDFHTFVWFQYDIFICVESE